VAAFNVYCLTGGWTMVAKVASTSTLDAWGFDSARWTDATLLNTNSYDLSNSDAKFQSYLSVPFTTVKLTMTVGTVTTGIDVSSGSYTSFQSLMNAGSVTTNAPVIEWRNLFDIGSQPNCNLQGFSISNGLNSLRLGILFNDQNDCSSPDRYFGVGFGGTAQSRFGEFPAGAFSDGRNPAQAILYVRK